MDTSIIDSIYCPHSFGKNSSDKLFSPFRDNVVHYHSLGRYALLEGLKVLGIKQDDSVLVPSFICRDLLAPFNMLGIEIDFYDVDQNLRPTELRKKHNTKAVLACNYFGLPCDIDFFKNFCESENLFLIEDNAHGMLSSKNSKYLGTFGDIGIFSIRKTLPLINGAALLINNKKLSTSLNTNVNSQVWPIKSRPMFLYRLLGPRGMQQLTRVVRAVRKIRTGHEIPPSDDDCEHSISMDNDPVNIQDALERLDIKYEVQRRRKLYSLCYDVIGQFDVHIFEKELPVGVCPYVFPFIANDHTFEIIRLKLERMGIEVFTWPDLPLEIRTKCPEFYHQVRIVRFLW